MSLPEFVSMTFAMIILMLSERERIRCRDVDFPAGVIASVIINANPFRSAESEAVAPADILPSLARLDPKKKPAAETPEQKRIREAELLLAKSKMVFRQFAAPKT